VIRAVSVAEMGGICLQLIRVHWCGFVEYRPKGKPVAVRVHDFVDDELGKAIPYGLYDLSANAGWVSVGVDHDTAEFAVARCEHGGDEWDDMGTHVSF